MTSSTQYNQSSNINIRPKQQQQQHQQQQSRHQQQQQLHQQYPRTTSYQQQASYPVQSASYSSYGPAITGPPFDLTPGITPVPGKPNYYTLTRRGLKNSLYAAEDCPKCGVTATTPAVRLPHTRVPPPGTRASKHWNRRTEYLFQPFFRGSCPEFAPSGSVYGSAPTAGFNLRHPKSQQAQLPRSLPEPKCTCSRKQNPLHQLHDHAVTVTDQQQSQASRHQSYYPHSSAPPSPPLPRAASSLQYYYSPRRRTESLFDKTGFDRDPQSQQQKHQVLQYQNPQPFSQKQQARGLQKQLTFQDESYNLTQSPQRRQPQIQPQQQSGRILTIPRIEVGDDSDLQSKEPAVKSSEGEARKDRDIINRREDRDQEDSRTNRTRGRRDSEEEDRRRQEEEDQRQQQRRLHREEEERRLREEDEEDRQRELERERRRRLRQQEHEERLRREEEEDRQEQERLRKRRTDEEKRRIEEREELDRRRRQVFEQEEKELKEAEEQLQKRREERDLRHRQEVTQQRQLQEEQEQRDLKKREEQEDRLRDRIVHDDHRRDSFEAELRRRRSNDDKLLDENNGGDDNRVRQTRVRGRVTPPKSLPSLNKSTASAPNASENTCHSHCPHSKQEQQIRCQQSVHHCCCCAPSHQQDFTNCPTCNNMPSRSDNPAIHHHHHPHHHSMHNQPMHQVHQSHHQSSSEYNSPTHHHARGHHPQQDMYPSPPSHAIKTTGGFNALIPQLQKVVKFNLNPSYSKSSQHAFPCSRPVGRTSSPRGNHVPG